MLHTNQQLLIAFAIPPRACINPGPETTRQTPGLKKSSFYINIGHCSKDDIISINKLNNLQINPIKCQSKNKKL